jgi:hypothetical protein
MFTFCPHFYHHMETFTTQFTLLAFSGRRWSATLILGLLLYLASTCFSTVQAQADLATVLSGPNTAAPGTSVTYTLITTNGGPASAIDVFRTLSLPPNSNVTVPPGGSYDSNSGIVTWPLISSLAANGSPAISAVTFVMPATPVTAIGNASSNNIDNDFNNNFSILTTTTSQPLPVSLARFEARALGSDALLSWTTASELDNDRFEIERSFDARSFERVGRERGQGSSTRPTAYRFTDAGAGRQGHALAYYRLRQVDTDGTVSWSPVRVVNFTSLSKASVGLYPNPAPSRTTLDLTDLPMGAYQVRILDLTGREVGTYELEGAGKHPLSVERLLPGSYVVCVVGPAGNLSLPLVRD